MERFTVPARFIFFGVLVSMVIALSGARAAGDSLTLDEVRKFQESGGGVLLDARGAKFFAKSHIPGALSLPVNDFDKAYENIQAKLKRDGQIVIYCSSVNCPDSGRLRDKLVKLGYTRVEIFKGGLAAWWKAGLPMEKAEPAK
jgi:rhodanese-related sulfurtransferase